MTIVFEIHRDQYSVSWNILKLTGGVEMTASNVH